MFKFAIAHIFPEDKSNFILAVCPFNLRPLKTGLCHLYIWRQPDFIQAVKNPNVEIPYLMKRIY